MDAYEIVERLDDVTRQSDDDTGLSPEEVLLAEKLMRDLAVLAVQRGEMLWQP